MDRWIDGQTSGHGDSIKLPLPPLHPKWNLVEYTITYKNFKDSWTYQYNFKSMLGTQYMYFGQLPKFAAIILDW